MATLSARRLVRGLDVGALTSAVVLVIIGLAALFSFALNVNQPSYQLLWKQSLLFAVGLMLAVVIARFDYRWLAGVHWILYGLAVLSLVLLFFFGRTVHSTTGWFVIGGFQIQPVEFVKLILVVFLAKYLAGFSARAYHWTTLATSGGWTAILATLVVMHHDLGSALILFGIWLIMILILPIRRRYIAVGLVAISVLAFLAWLLVLQPYQRDRIVNFLIPSRDRYGTGYNVRQAVTAIGSGQITGRGLGLGPQSQLNFLPERQTDFIFASIAEELGLIGGGLVILVYGWFFWRWRRVIMATKDIFSLLLTTGLATMFFIQVIINIGMNMGLFPVTGIPLPFISYGGSSLIACWMAVGLLESVSVRQGVR